MPQNIFKIYDGRTNFWQWDTGQKLIVLDKTVTEVHFSNRDMNHSITKYVYENKDGIRVCNVPDLILQLPRNLIAYAYANGATMKSVKFAVIKRPIPDGYVMDQTEELDEIAQRLELLEAMLKDIEQGTQEMKKFEDIVDAATWAKQNGKSGIIIVIRIDSKWVPHVIEDDFSLTPICDCNGEMITLVFDGDDADGVQEDEVEEEEIIQYFDGGSAFGI